jgi:hypothetical protein
MEVVMMSPERAEKGPIPNRSQGANKSDLVPRRLIAFAAFSGPCSFVISRLLDGLLTVLMAKGVHAGLDQ